VGRAISRANAGMAGNIIFGGGIGAIIDHNKGTAYSRRSKRRYAGNASRRCSPVFAGVRATFISHETIAK
jgi:hypothetical protein